MIDHFLTLICRLLHAVCEGINRLQVLLFWFFQYCSSKPSSAEQRRASRARMVLLEAAALPRLLQSFNLCPLPSTSPLSLFLPVTQQHTQRVKQPPCSAGGKQLIRDRGTPSYIRSFAQLCAVCWSPTRRGSRREAAAQLAPCLPRAPSSQHSSCCQEAAVTGRLQRPSAREFIQQAGFCIRCAQRAGR